MAQDFEKAYKSQVTTSAHTLLTSDSDDALIGIRLTNITTSAVTVDVWIDVAAAGTTASVVYIADDLSIPPKSSVELIQGGAKIVIQSTDLLRVQASAATSISAYVSYVDAISA
jgi:predicted RecA/RadA family phage recombinase|tara:strand:+ start:103 stop:444 length:342 start_codon:yes stop_codon:yes gene_type:complete